MTFLRTTVCLVLLAGFGFHSTASAQQILGAITGTVKDVSGGAVPGASIKAVNSATNLTVSAVSQGNGSYVIQNLPAGTYRVTISKDGFDTSISRKFLSNSAGDWLNPFFNRAI